MKKKNYIIPAIVTVITILFTILTVIIDRGIVKETNTAVGFYTINTAFHSLTGTNMGWYTITNILGFVSIGVGLIFAVLGLIQLIQRRNVFMVDKSILLLGVVIVLLGVLYVGFEKVIINYRPIIMPGASSPEASFPSSHTLLIVTILGCTMIAIKRMFKYEYTLQLVINIICALLIIVAIFGRLICGVHWVTDILAGVLMSATIVAWYYELTKE